MSDVRRFIESGILEMYVSGCTGAADTALVEEMMLLHPEVKMEVDAIADALEQYAMANAVTPDPTIRPFLMATIDYMERMKAGEAPSFPPLLRQNSVIADYKQWLDRPDMVPEEPLEDACAHIIGHTPEAMTAIVWLKYGAPPETHTHEYEKFLVVEGTCDITINQDVHSLRPGDVLIIPLYATHHVRVTSPCPCKIILQRAAA